MNEDEKKAVASLLKAVGALRGALGHVAPLNEADEHLKAAAAVLDPPAEEKPAVAG